MIRRVGWPSVFCLVAGLVFAGLGWVTYAALGVERAQREAAARAELGGNLRLALWRLDGRMYPVFSVEDSRPFYHYDSADPAGTFGPAATPLLTATLQDWMRLHFQLDPNKGWTSNQAPTDPGECARVKDAWADLPLTNFGGPREAALADLRAKFPARVTCELFGARERAIPADSLPFAAPLFTEVSTSDPAPANPVAVVRPPESAPKPPPPADAAPSYPEPAADAARVLGFDLCPRPADALQHEALQLRNTDAEAQKARAESKNRGTNLSNVAVRGQRAENDPGALEYLKRAQSFGKALEEAKNAYDSPRNAVQSYQNELKYQQQVAGNKADLFPPFSLAPPVGPAGAGKGAPAAPGPGAPAAPAAAPGVPAPGAGAPAAPTVGDSKEAEARDDALRFRAEKLEVIDRMSLGLYKSALAEQDRRDLAKKLDAGEAKSAVKPRPSGAAGEDRPALPLVPPPTPHAVHLGSMRPQWVTGPDGTEALMLVRAARLEFRPPGESRTVYQGVVIDWPKLEAKLRDEVRDLFPDARLVPVRDPEGVSPDRAMTALPVQLDPGAAAEPPPAGWTPLRFGLALAWVAALIAVGAVGFGGWTLIDLAERRIRFVSAVTHELRTPLTSLRLYLDLLVSGMITDEAKRQEYLNTLATESDRLHRLIDNVLDFARLEKRRKNGDVKPVRVSELVDQLRHTWGDRLAQDGRELVAVCTLSPEREVPTDAAMVQQIVGNLIENARKYARDAADTRIWLWARPGPGTAVVFEVEDRGPGVPAAERRTIFKPFRRGTGTEATGGAGLGLALAKSWAAVLGGRLTYRPADGGTGACFRLELPGA
ncbi:histidine kinase : Histidine kinase OS=Pirellula staleyi (strain ATCC 27377 / DSM 6068 / ICPB 4128) GN=Psta_3871 PE=4 SV=1: HisKA: HATPase_c [Gemmataceae bacterium]|nr:histidine kinase : Histidine kinase OS=Pirellula staleyi (strain ATCC 27377 / DSM 6068 / ICPB 4128) GN=Psta_3871 PE=4 SV=1: HisKA: HATPase_c [Gemmataceae bacterium]VTU00067.1 histidine kinase : Histidine kinase OS=Pirellula staleyi (strain ATCC 27377 / DSM 6068 / ICPB 4128) GN=Psta_3871 PE=4 SV=1: HisKA: HATPase_c [Gemmataceae bacterium]